MENLENTARSIRQATGRDIFWERLERHRCARVGQFVAAVEQRFGGVDIRVTNAGGPPAKSFLEISLEEWCAAVGLTLLSAVYFAREVLPRTRKNRWGRLVTITSISAKQPIDGLLLLNSIRPAVTGLVSRLANEFGADGITVNNVGRATRSPSGSTSSPKSKPGQRASRARVFFQRWAGQIPLGRLAKPEEFAALVTFLVSERSGYINGARIAVDGGWVRSLL